MSSYIPIAVSFFAAMATIFAAWLTIRVGRKKSDAEASETFTDAALKLIDPLTARIDELERHQNTLEEKITKLEAENRSLHRWSQVLSAQVVDGGGVPYTFDQISKLSEDK